ncbi:hypothetical protein ACTJI8_12765 [Microbacterium sp. 22303]|uniref:hypothetical protein n=1 Tax=Microbacterium sp. 22303 TaxID=3453905 RepID=UPI003F83DD73
MQELESLALLLADMNTQIRALQGALRDRDELIGVLQEENAAQRVEIATDKVEASAEAGS